LIKLKQQLVNEKELDKQLKELKKLNFEKEELLKISKEDFDKKSLKKIEFREKEIQLSFKGEYEIFEYLNLLSKSNNIIIDTIGREIDNKNMINSKEIFFHGIGLEKDIYNFIYDIEKSERKISLNEHSILLEINESVLELKVNIVYMINNKVEKIDYDFYNNGIFEKSKIREIGKKRRKL
jgi:hypothetical protein